MLNGKKQASIVMLRFTNGYGTNTIDGNGNEDIYGAFNITGTFNDKAPYAVEFTFKFSTGTRMEFSGWRESDKGGVFGTWKGDLGSGTFAYSPSKEASEAAKKLEQGAKSKMKENLLSMGFEDWIIDEALNECKSLEDAINWITRQSSSSSSSSQTNSSTVQVDESSLTQLVSMGFDSDMAREALSKNGNDVEQAANWLAERM